MMLRVPHLAKLTDFNINLYLHVQKLCRVGEHQHRLAHKCSPCEKIVQSDHYDEVIHWDYV